MMKIGFIGTGEITKAVVLGILKSKIKYQKIYISERNKKISNYLKRKSTKISIQKYNQDIINKSNFIFLAITPEVGAKIIKKLNFKNIQILWQTGDKEFQQYSSLSNKYIKVVPFINDMASAYSLSNLVICRSGALTISELTACGKPSILIPFAAAAGDHQLKNAKTLSKKGASIIIEEKDFDSKILLSKINELINDDSKLSSMSIASKKLGNKDATKMIVDLIAKGNYIV